MYEINRLGAFSISLECNIVYPPANLFFLLDFARVNFVIINKNYTFALSTPLRVWADIYMKGVYLSVLSSTVQTSQL